jgi:hypothetical protein
MGEINKAAALYYGRKFVEAIGDALDLSVSINYDAEAAAIEAGERLRHKIMGESVNGKPADSKPATPGSSPGSPAIEISMKIDYKEFIKMLQYWSDWKQDVDVIVNL